MKIITLVEYLQESGLSVAQFAAKSGISEQAIYKYCNGQRMPRRSAIKKMKIASSGKIGLQSFDETEIPRTRHNTGSLSNTNAQVNK
jgi:transcriptional regulator with XRE-family HTH domain